MAELTVHLIPVVGTADHFFHGSTEDFFLSLAGDVALGAGTFSKFVQGGAKLHRLAATVEMGAAGYRGIQAAQAAFSGEGGKAAMYFGEAVLRLFGAKAIMNAGQASRGKAWLKILGATAEEEAALARAAGMLDDVPVKVAFSSSAARIPGPTWQNMSQLRAYLDRQGIGLAEDGAWYLDKFGSKKMAAFDWSRSRPMIFLRLDATRAEVLHEIGHGLAYRRLGKSLYESLDDPIRESIASAFVTGRMSFTRRMTFQQLMHEFKNMKSAIPTDILERLRGIL